MLAYLTLYWVDSLMNASRLCTSVLSVPAQAYFLNLYNQEIFCLTLIPAPGDPILTRFKPSEDFIFGIFVSVKYASIAFYSIN